MRRLRTFVLAVGFFVASSANAAELVPEKHDWDFTLKLGVTTGAIKKTDPTTKVVSDFTYGGLPFMIALNNDLTRGISIFGEIQMVIDPTIFQVTRTGFDLGLAIHLFGGPRRMIEEFGEIGVIRREPYNISLLARFGLHRYVAAEGSNALSGSLFDTMVGAQGRFDVDDLSALTFEVYTTAFTLAGSLDGLSTSQMMFLFGWRFFL